MNFYDFLEQLTDKYDLEHNPNHFLDDPTRDDITDFDHLCDELRDNGFFNIEEIYYSVAIKYLSENDSSLAESLELAHFMGYEVQDLNSEILASLLASENFTREFFELEEDVNEFLNQ